MYCDWLSYPNSSDSFASTKTKRCTNTKNLFFSNSSATWHNKDFVMPIWCLPSDWFRANFCFIQLSRPQVPHLQDWLWQKGKRDLPRFKLLIGQLTQILRPDWSKPRIRPSMMTILPLTAQSSCWNETGPKLEPLHRTSQYKFLFIGLRIEPENSFNQWIIPPHHTTDLKSQIIMLDGVFPIGKVNWSIQEVVYGKLYNTGLMETGNTH